jgi:type I restriction enzyme M protein
MDSIEQFSYLLFLKRLDDAENQREKQLKRRNIELFGENCVSNLRRRG